MAEHLLEFIQNSPTAYHAAENALAKLKKNDFIELKLNEPWRICPGQKYCLRVNHSTVIGFAVGGKYQNGNGFSIVASHTDSPCLKLKPNPNCLKMGYRMIRAQTYGGGIWHTWFDRDLTLAGIVTIRDKGAFKPSLIHIKNPILRIPQLAIHLSRKINENLSIMPENDLIPVLSLDASDSSSEQKNEFLTQLIAKHLSIDEKDIIDIDLNIVDTQPPCFGGLNQEFIFSPRLDNLFNVHCSLEGFLTSLENDSLKGEKDVKMFVAYDNEEVGSCSYQGANSSILPNLLKKIIEQLGGDYFETISNSFLLSADQSHSTHPNYQDKHEENHHINLNDGIVLKYNCDQQYATSCITASIVKLIAEKCSVPVQKFVVRNDMPCGSTVGPILSALVGIRVADVGFPMLSMHSIREMCSADSVSQAVTFFKAYYKELASILSETP